MFQLSIKEVRFLPMIISKTNENHIFKEKIIKNSMKKHFTTNIATCSDKITKDYFIENLIILLNLKKHSNPSLVARNNLHILSCVLIINRPAYRERILH